MAHGVFDVITEDPEEPHIADQMKPAAVQKHRRDRRIPARRVTDYAHAAGTDAKTRASRHGLQQLAGDQAEPTHGPKSMGSVPMPWRNTHAMTFSAMIPYVIYGIRKCGLSSRIGNICSLHGAATGSSLSESRGRSDAPQRSRVLVRCTSSNPSSPGACREVAVCARPRSVHAASRGPGRCMAAAARGRSTRCFRHHRADTGIAFPCKKSIDAS